MTKACILFIFLIIASPQALAVPPALDESSKEPLSFGALLMLTGDAGYLGERCRNGMELASEDVNKAGGIRGRKLKVLYEDFGTLDLKRAASAAHKLIDVDHVAAIFPGALEDTELIAPLAERAKVPLMSSGAGGVNIGKLGPNVFRATTTDQVMLEALFSYAALKSYRKMCLVHADSAYFESVAEAADEIGVNHKLSLIKVSVPVAESDLKTVAVRLMRRGCDAVTAVVMPVQFRSILREFRAAGSKLPLLGPPYIDYEQIGREFKSKTGDVVFTRYPLAEEEFASRYRARFRSEPLRPAGHCYDAVRVMSESMQRSGFEFAAVNSALRGMRDYPGVTGPFSLMSNGDRIGETAEIWRITQDGSGVEKVAR